MQDANLVGSILGLYDFHARYYDPVLGRWFNVDPKLQLTNPYAYCGNNPVCYVDPDGEFIWLICAILGGVMNLAMNAGNIDNFWQGLGYFAVGAAAGQAVAGAVGTIGFAGGAMTGAAAGFSSGFITSAGNAWIGGANFGNGLLSGLKTGAISGLAGGVIGGLVGGINALQHDGIFWSGKGATFDAPGLPVTGDKIEVGEGMQYSTEYAQNFSNDNYSPNIKGLNELHADGTMPKGYTAKGDQVLNRLKTPVRGSAVYQGTGKGTNVYLYKAAFVSKDQLYLTMGHEYLHCGFNAAGLMGAESQHASIHQWEGRQAHVWGLNISGYARKFEAVKSFFNPIYNYQNQGFYILGVRPWY